MMTTKKSTAVLCFLFCAQFVMAQERIIRPNIGLKWAPTGLSLGSLSLHAEYNFGKNSLTAKIGVPVAVHHTLSYDGKEADFSMKATSFLAGYRTYLSKKHMKGLYFEPFFKYVHHTSEGAGLAVLSGETVKMNFTNDYNGAGFGVQLGAQFLIADKFVIDFFFLGPEANAARNNFKAVELSDVIPWTNTQAWEAEADIRDFIDKFPFVRNKVNVSVDQANKTVRADFKGTLPGYRIGISFGVAF
ncbi:MAG TPA: hypothetical protein VNR87_01840 [Flavisolibacter sp.]|nr:hypothetical protein [Flavisolibacter sp.]